MKRLLVFAMAFVLCSVEVATPVLAGGGCGSRRGTTVNVAPNGYGRGRSDALLTDLIVLSAICDARQERDRDNAEELLTVLLPLIISMMQQQQPQAQAQPQIFLIPDGSAGTPARIASTNQVRLHPKYIQAAAKYATLQKKAAKQPNGRVVTYYQFVGWKQNPHVLRTTGRTRYPVAAR